MRLLHRFAKIFGGLNPLVFMGCCEYLPRADFVEFGNHYNINAFRTLKIPDIQHTYRTNCGHHYKLFEKILQISSFVCSDELCKIVGTIFVKIQTGRFPYFSGGPSVVKRGNMRTEECNKG